MSLGLPARLILRINEKTGLPRLNHCLIWLRLTNFAASVSFMGIFVNLYAGLPRGFVATYRVTPIFALAIIAGVYPIVAPILFLGYEKYRSKLHALQMSRAADSLILSPMLIALAVLLGDAGVPATCDNLYDFDIEAYRSPLERLRNVTAVCSVHDSSNECGDGYRQVNDIRDMCQSVQAGFALVILVIVLVYFAVAVGNFYLYRASKEEGGLPLHNTSPSQQHLVAEIQRPGTAHVRGGGGEDEPPPPYTATAATSEMTILTPMTSVPTLNSTTSTLNMASPTLDANTPATDVVVATPNTTAQSPVASSPAQETTPP